VVLIIGAGHNAAPMDRARSQPAEIAILSDKFTDIAPNGLLSGMRSGDILLRSILLVVASLDGGRDYANMRSRLKAHSTIFENVHPVGCAIEA
jgi:hypothetical protein